MASSRGTIDELCAVVNAMARRRVARRAAICRARLVVDADDRDLRRRDQALLDGRIVLERAVPVDDDPA